jgi:hypothetical protein
MLVQTVSVSLLPFVMPVVLAGEMRDGDSALKKMRLDFTGQLDGHKVYGRAIGPDCIEVCNAVALEAAQNGQFENLLAIKL